MKLFALVALLILLATPFAAAATVKVSSNGVYRGSLDHTFAYTPGDTPTVVADVQQNHFIFVTWTLGEKRGELELFMKRRYQNNGVETWEYDAKYTPSRVDRFQKAVMSERMPLDFDGDGSAELFMEYSSLERLKYGTFTFFTNEAQTVPSVTPPREPPATEPSQPPVNEPVPPPTAPPIVEQPPPEQPSAQQPPDVPPGLLPPSVVDQPVKSNNGLFYGLGVLVLIVGIFVVFSRRANSRPSHTSRKPFKTDAHVPMKREESHVPMKREAPKVPVKQEEPQDEPAPPSDKPVIVTRSPRMRR